MPRSGAWILTLLLLAVFAVVAYLALLGGAEGGKGLPAYSVYSSDADGLATAARVLRKLGWQPVALTRPIQHTRHRGLLLLVEPRPTGLLTEDGGLSEADSKALLDWVGQGNTLVLCGRKPTRLHEALGVTLRADKASAEAAVYAAEANEIGGYTEPGSAGDTVRIQQIGVEGRDAVQAKKGLPLWLNGDQVGALLLPHGQGRVLVIADPSLWTHRGLLRYDNVLLLYNLAVLDAVEGRVYFDEYHHGLRSGGGYWDYLRYHDQHWNVLQLLAVAAVACWGAATRLGPAVPLPPPLRADAVDYASAVARIYQRASVRHLLAQNMVRDFLEAVTAHLRLRRTVLPAQILAAWRQRHPGEPPERLAELLRGVAELRRVATGAAEMSEEELLHWAATLDRFVRGLGK